METKRKNIQVGIMKALFLTVCIFFGCFTHTLVAQSLSWKGDRQISMRMTSIINTHIRLINKWAQNPVLINSVIKQNQKNVPLDEIIKIDKQWLAGEINNFAISLQKNRAGKLLYDHISQNSRLYVEAFLCDEKGAVVAEYPKTTDYWQGDEEKFLKSYNSGKGQIDVGPLSFDDSTKTNSVQISIPVFDKKKTIDVLIVGLKNIK
tara:strand:+ start:65 stop:682 length:618 start_codon:yes stop_codon:yes gene_type:complete